MAEKKRPELHAMVREQFISNVKAMPREIHQTLGAVFRTGIKDLQNFFANPFGEQPIAVHEEPNMPFMPPMYEPPLYNQLSRDNDRLFDPPAPVVGQRLEKGVER